MGTLSATGGTPSDNGVLPGVAGPAWPGVRIFCTTRAGGIGQPPFDTLNLGLGAGQEPAAVQENRRRLRACLPAEPVWLRQVHGVAVHDADTVLALPLDVAPSLDLAPPPEEEGAAGIAADAAVTTSAGRVLAILTADCLPVVIVDVDGRALGVAHAGWRGLAAGVLEQTLAALRQRCPQAAGWRAWIGPGIGPAAFEVGADVVQAFVATDPQARQAFVPKPGTPGKWLADLPALAQRRLHLAGVDEVSACGLCTVADAQRFFSYRRDGRTGRMATLAWLLEPSAGGGERQP